MIPTKYEHVRAQLKALVDKDKSTDAATKATINDGIDLLVDLAADLNRMAVAMEQTATSTKELVEVLSERLK